FLKLDQGSGVEVHSKQSLTLKANDITFAGKSISMSATESMRLTCGTSSLVLDSITDMQGQVVRMEGSNKAPVSVSNKSGDGVDLGSALDVMGMIPVGGGGA
ncbi:contractile injection system protein, VgrG/Pvc8 family, partial [Lysinibacillus sp. NPDC093688]